MQAAQGAGAGGGRHRRCLRLQAPAGGRGGGASGGGSLRSRRGSSGGSSSSSGIRGSTSRGSRGRRARRRPDCSRAGHGAAAAARRRAGTPGRRAGAGRPAVPAGRGGRPGGIPGARGRGGGRAQGREPGEPAGGRARGGGGAAGRACGLPCSSRPLLVGTRRWCSTAEPQSASHPPTHSPRCRPWGRRCSSRRRDWNSCSSAPATQRRGCGAWHAAPPSWRGARHDVQQPRLRNTRLQRRPHGCGQPRLQRWPGSGGRAVSTAARCHTNIMLCRDRYCITLYEALTCVPSVVRAWCHAALPISAGLCCYTCLVARGGSEWVGARAGGGAAAPPPGQLRPQLQSWGSQPPIPDSQQNTSRQGGGQAGTHPLSPPSESHHRAPLNSMPPGACVSTPAQLLPTVPRTFTELPEGREGAGALTPTRTVCSPQECRLGWRGRCLCTDSMIYTDRESSGRARERGGRQRGPRRRPLRCGDCNSGT